MKPKTNLLKGGEFHSRTAVTLPQRPGERQAGRDTHRCCTLSGEARLGAIFQRADLEDVALSPVLYPAEVAGLNDLRSESGQTQITDLLALVKRAVHAWFLESVSIRLVFTVTNCTAVLKVTQLLLLIGLSLECLAP